MLSDFGIILLFIISGIGLIGLILGLNRLLRKDAPNEEKNTTYESGEEPIGNTNTQFNVRFYVIALIFVLFEVEVLFLFPWAIVFGDETLIKETNGLWGWFALAEMIIFVAILAVGLAYAWGKGYLDWVYAQPKPSERESPVPSDLYSQVNERYRSKK